MNDPRVCPYCGVLPRSSDDHIFPEFLGGKTTIRACKPCNDLFGHDFEGPVSADFAPVVVTLRRGGIRSPRRVVWKHAIKIEGVDYDLDSDLHMARSEPSIERDENGLVKRAVFANFRAAKGFIRGHEAEGKKLKQVPQTFEGIDIRQLQFEIKIGTEMRRLAIKLAISAADHMGLSDGLTDTETREFLLGKIQSTARARVDFAIHQELEKRRPPLSHLVFVKGNQQTGNSYAIVQFYGLVQLYILLNHGQFVRNDFAVLAVLDVAKGYAERFEQTELLMFPEAPTTWTPGELQALKFSWANKYSAEARVVLQDDAKVYL